MSITEKISHAAERKAFETILESMLKKGQTQDVSDLAEQLIDMIQKIHKDTWSDKSYETLRMVAENPDGKWARYTQRIIRENDPYILKTFLTNVAYEGGFRGYQTAQENAGKYGINVPWLILMDPTSACNMHCTDFQNDGEFAGGCVAGGRIYCHINAAGDVEPCVFIHYSGANIREKSFLECLRQPLFKLYREGQPFHDNHLRPCPMLENPELLPKMVAESGAHSTDLEAPESAEHLCEKCRAYAECWTPEADKLWAEDHKPC